jgi:hypothetical protein
MLGTIVYGLPPLVLMSIILIGTISVSLLMLWGCRRYFSIGKTEADAVKIETYSDAFGIAFAILLGLIIVTAWTSYDKTDDLVQTEANYLSDLYQQSEYLNDVARKELRQNLRDYIKEVISVEWPLLKQGNYSQTADNLIFRNFHILYQYVPSDKKEEFVLAQMNKIATDATEKRRSRVLNASSSLTPIMWFILFACNIIGFFILGLYTEGRTYLHVILQCVYAIGTGLMLLLVIILDRPFYDFGGGVSSEPFKKLIHEWDQEENRTQAPENN